jgi:hypothetical protein
MSKPWVTTKICLLYDQSLNIQATDNMDGIQIQALENDNITVSNFIYLTKDEFPIVIKKLQEMMEYVTSK